MYDLRGVTGSPNLLSHTIFRVGDYVFLDGPPLCRSSAGQFASENYDNLLPRKQGPYQAIEVNDSTLHTLQKRLEDMV